MSKKIVPKEFKTGLLDEFINSIDTETNNTYYTFIGDHLSDGETEQEIVQPDSSVSTINIETYRNMIFGKKLSSDDVKFMINRNEWTSNTVYARYDDEDINLYNKNFYIMTDEGAFKHVYKCLNNANNSPSTSQPVFNDFTFDGDNYYETGDGYQWKYMYSIEESIFNKFATQKYIPVIANNDVVEYAKNGTIDVIKIQTEERLGETITLNGKFYNNYITGGLFSTGDILIGNTVQYALPSSASTVRGFYGNTILHIVSGTGAGQYKRVVDSYFSVSLNNIIIQIESAFTVPLDGTSNYELSPEVQITGDGSQTIEARARAVINANSSNSVHKVEMLDVGLNYNYATATILNGVPASNTGTSVGDLVIPTDAVLKPIIPPPNGHGSNTAFELGASTLCVYSKFSKEEDGTIPAENTFAQFGIIKNPRFANVEIDTIKKSDSLDGYDGNFIVDENVYQFKKILLSGNVDVVSSNTTILSSASDTYYDAFLSSNDYVYITNTSNPTYNTFSKISSVANSNAIILESAPTWTAVDSELYYAKIISSGKVNIVAAQKIYLKSVDKPIILGELIAGETSSAIANVSHIDINSKYESPSNYNFNLFTQFTKCVGTITGSFQDNELVYQGDDLESATFTGYVHSSNSTHLYLTNISGSLNQTLDVIGESGILPPPFNKYNGDLDATAGNIIYLQNEVPVLRANNQSEEIRVILEF